MKEIIKLVIILLCASLLFACGSKNENETSSLETNEQNNKFASYQKDIEDATGYETHNGLDFAYIIDTNDNISLVILPYADDKGSNYNKLCLYGENTDADFSYTLVYDIDTKEYIGVLSVGEDSCVYDVTNKQVLDENCTYLDDTIDVLSSGKDFMEAFFIACNHDAQEILDYLRWYHDHNAVE